MKYQDFSKSTQSKISAFAASRGISREEVVAQFEKLFAGGKVSKHSRPIFSAL